MSDVSNGALSFKALLDNGQLVEVINETLERVQGLSDATVAGGKQMDKAFLQTADDIRQALGQIGSACEIHETELAKLEAEYERLGKEASIALSSGRDAEAKAIRETQTGIKGEMVVRKQALEDARNLSNELEKEAQKREEVTKAAERNAQAHQTLRGRIRDLKEEMALYREAYGDQTEEYRRMSAELGRLTDIQGDVATQAKILANDQAKFQGVLQGLSGLSGGFSAATGAISLFAGENENLQMVMTKVQSVMAITMGLQQVSQTLNKDSAFQLVTLNGLKEWWTGIVGKATVAETAETVAIQTNTIAKEQNAAVTGQVATTEALDTAAKGANTAAATAGSVANFTLAGAFRAVGLAIKSIPVFGWILTGISALIALVGHFSSKAQEAKKAQEEFTKAMIEGAYKPIGKIEELSTKYTALGNNIKDKEKFIKDNKQAFDELGVSIRSVADADKLLIDNKEAFVAAQIDKAKALAYTQQAAEHIKKLITLQAEYEAMSDTQTRLIGGGSSFGGGTIVQIENKAKLEKKKEIDALNKIIKDGYTNAVQEEANHIEKLKEAGIKKANEYEQGTVRAIEQAIQAKQEALKDLVPNSEKWKETYKEIDALQKQIESPSKKNASKGEKDPFVQMLEKRKAEYERYYKWQNSADEEIRNAAKTEFAKLIEGGSSYEAFLKRLHDNISSLPQNSRTIAQLKAIRNELAEIDKTTILETFNETLQEEIDGTDYVLQRLAIIAQKREELKNGGYANTSVGREMEQALDKAEKSALKKQQDETKKLLDEYASYLDRKIELDLKYSNDLVLLERARAKATTDEERRRIDAVMANRKEQHQKDHKTTGNSEYDEMLQAYRTFERKKDVIDEEFKKKRKIREQMLADFRKELSEAQTEDEKQAIQKRIAENEEMAKQLEKAYKDAASRLVIDEMKISPDWEKLFGNFDEMGTKELERLLEMIEGKTAILGIELSPEDFKVIQDKVKALKNEIKERNPFKALAKGFEDFKNATSDDDKVAAMAGMFDSAGKAGNQLKDIITDITSTLEALGVEGTEEIGHAIQALEGLGKGAQDAVMGFMSGNPVQMVGGAIKAIGSVVNYFAGANDRRAEHSIKKHEANVKRLQNAYKELEWQISKALSSNAYRHQQAAIENMKQQQQELQAMIRAEESKKKSDDGKIAEYKAQIKELDRSIEDTVDGMRDQLLASDAKTIVAQLGDAIIGAFEQGKDAAKAWGDTVNNIVNNLVKNMLVQKVLEEPINKIISKYTDNWVDTKGNFKGFDVVLGSIDDLTNELAGEFPKLEQAINAIKGKLKLANEDVDTSLTGAVKGVTEETASVVAGQLNAMRINQGEANNILRQQLAMLSDIAHNTSYNRFLAEIHKELKLINAGSTSPLRAQGLVNL